MSEPKFTPTPTQIAKACEKIQREWTPAEKMRRANKHRGRVEGINAQGSYRISDEAGVVE